MAMTSDQIKSWIDLNWLNKSNYRETETVGMPLDTPPVSFLIHNDVTSKIIWTWNGIKWTKGLGGGGSFEAVDVVDNSPLTAVYSKTYILNSANIAGKIITIDLTTFEEMGQQLIILDNYFIDADTTITIKSAPNVMINGVTDDIVFNLNGGMISIMCVGITKDTDDVITALDCQIHSYGTASQQSVKPIEFPSSTFVVSQKQYMVDCSASALTATVDTGFESGQSFSIYDYNGMSQTNNILVDFMTNGYKINSVSDNFIFDENNSMCKFIYVNDTIGFKPLYGQF